MFAKLAVPFVTLAAMATGALAGPLALKPAADLALRGFSSFNHWGGFSSMDNFDNFYGEDNFDGSSFSQTVVEQQEEVVCHTQTITIIQQRLLVLQEMAKRIITEQVCDVETQTFAFEQFHSSLGSFSHDLRRQSGHHVGFDSNIVSHFGDIVNSDGSFNYDDFGFSGHDLGKSTVVVGGSNWDDSRSFASVGNAFNAARGVIHSSH